MSKYLKLSVAVLLVVGALFGEPIVEFLKDNVEIINTPSVNVDEPSLEYRTLVQDIVAIDISNSDARHISDFFSQLSDVVWLDPGFLKTTGVFREFNVKAGGLNFAGLELKNKSHSQRFQGHRHIETAMVHLVRVGAEGPVPIVPLFLT